MKNKLLEFRKTLHYSQEEMSKILKVSRQTYSKIESGKSSGSVLFWKNFFEKFKIEESEKFSYMM